MSDIATMWGETVAWLHDNAPSTAATIRPPASAELIAEVAASMGRPVPMELEQWWQQADGMRRSPRGCLIPWGFVPMSCQDTLEIREEWLNSDIALDESDNELNVADDADFYAFHPSFLPIADDLCGGSLCIDMRNGPRNSHIGVFGHESGWCGADFYYPNLTHMLLEIRNGLIDGAPVAAGMWRGTARTYRASVTPDRELQWVDAI